MNLNALKEGTILHFGSYTIKRVLGHGGFGITYLAWDNSLDKEVAIKEFFPQSLCGREDITNHITLGTQSNGQLLDDLKNKFIKEARNIARLNHPNIVRIHTSFEENNSAYYVMDYIQGESLSEIVKKRGAMSEKEASHYIEQIGNALSYLHSHHMTHLDVKPANIMVGTDGIPVLIDFGLSKNYDHAGNQTTTRGPMGISPGYSPLEQYTLGGAKEFSPKSDLYSLAATYYYLLTAKTPPEATLNAGEQITLPSRISAPVRSAIQKAMSSSQGQRHETVNEFLKHIEGKNPRDDEATVMVRHASDSTRIIPGHQRGGGGNDGRHNDGVIDTPWAPQSQVASAKNGNKKLMLYGIIAALAVACVVLVVLIVGKKDNEKSAIYNSEVEAALNSGDNSEVNQTEFMPTADSAPSTDPAPAVATSPYGPFDSREEVMDYINTHFAMSQGSELYTGDLAPTITTVFGGKAVTVSRSQFAQQNRDYASQQNHIREEHDVHWDSLSISPLADGGVLVKFNQEYRDISWRDGSEYTRAYDSDVEFKINSDRKIYYIKNKSMILNEWYN